MDKIETPREFEIDDCVEIRGEGDFIFRVSGVIHDSERLFIFNRNGKEVEVKFSDVTEQWRNIESLTARDALIRADERQKAAVWPERTEPDPEKMYVDVCPYCGESVESVGNQFPTLFEIKHNPYCEWLGFANSFNRKANKRILAAIMAEPEEAHS